MIRQYIVDKIKNNKQAFEGRCRCIRTLHRTAKFSAAFFTHERKNSHRG